MVCAQRMISLGTLRWALLGTLKGAFLTLTLGCGVSGHWFSDLLGVNDSKLEFISTEPSGILFNSTWTTNLAVEKVTSIVCTLLFLAQNCAFYAHGTDQRCHLFGIGQGPGIASSFRMQPIYYLGYNAALGSDVTSSPIDSTWSDPPSVVVAGDRTDDMFHSLIGGIRFPWIMVDLGTPCDIYEIRIFTRKNYYDPGRFLQVAVMLGDASPTVLDDFSSFTTVHTIPGPPPHPGAVYDVPVTPSRTGRYVALQRQGPPGPQNLLELLELEVYARKKVM